MANPWGCHCVFFGIVSRYSYEAIDKKRGLLLGVTVQFPNKGRVFRPSYSDEQELANAAEAALITVRGRTSTIVASPKDESLGLARAISTRKYLIDHGVSPLKVSINYAPGDFVADNSTPEGRLENQRVENRTRVRRAFRHKPKLNG